MFGLWLAGIAFAQDIVEFPEGQVLSSIRVRSMGGAATGIAEGAGSILLNPAAIAMRRPMVESSELDPDLALQVRDHPLLDAASELILREDIPKGVRRKGYWQIGGGTRYGRVGGSVLFKSVEYTNGESDLGTAQWSLGAGYAFDNIVFGVLPYMQTFTRQRNNAIGFGTSLGTLWAPVSLPLRLGARVRTPSRTGKATDGGIWRSRLPGELALGASYSVGATNAAGEWGPERHQGAWLAPVIVLAADLVVTGGTGKAKALEPLLKSGKVKKSGTTTSVRLGAEGILLRQDLRIRAGGYNVPARGNGFSQMVATAGAAYEITESARGIGIRGAGMIEVWSESWTWAVGIESW